MPAQTRSSGKRTTRSTTAKQKTGATPDKAQANVAPRTKRMAKLTASKVPQPQPRKRVRRASPEPEPVVAPPKRVRRKQGKLQGLMNMPVDIFAEIALYLYPVDLIYFARANRFFRQILMSRSFRDVWRSAERNIDGLPPCPKDLCEPKYAALVFTKYCSMCGESALRPMDPILQVRLCVKCRDKHAVDVSRVTDSTLVFISRTLMPGKLSYSSPSWCLYEDARTVKNKLNELAADDKAEEKTRWVKERKGIVNKRVQSAQPLIRFLKSVEEEHDTELSGVRKQREAEVRSRLLKLGWDEKDLNHWDSDWRKQWRSSACIAKPLTNRDWEVNVMPILVAYLEANKSSRLKWEQSARKLKRRDKTWDWISSTESHLAPFAEALDIANSKDMKLEATSTAGSSDPQTRLQPKSEGSTIPSERILKMAFPSRSDIVQWPTYKALIENEMTPEDLDLALQESRSTFDKLVLGWIKELEQTLFDWLPATDGGEELPLGVDNDSTTQTAVSIPEYTLAICTGSKKQSLSTLPGNVQRILRADAVFMRGSQPNFYPDDFNGTYFDKRAVAYNSKAAEIARAFVVSLGRPNAMYLEMKAAGAAFTCGRCQTGKAMTWKDLIRHYMDENNTKTTAQKHPRVRSSAVKYVFMHDVDEVIPDRPLLKAAPTDSLWSHGVGYHSRCLVCVPIGLNYWNRKEATLDHIRSVDPGTTQPPILVHTTTTDDNDWSEPYDPYLPRGGSSANPSGEPGRPPAGNAKTAAIQQQIDDTVGIMRENITRVAERGERLDVLQDKTDNLAVNAQGFRRGANRVRKNMWWKDMKMRIIIGIGIAILIVIIVVPIVKAVQNK